MPGRGSAPTTISASRSGGRIARAALLNTISQLIEIAREGLPKIPAATVKDVWLAHNESIMGQWDNFHAKNPQH